MRFLDAEFVQGFIRMANDGWEQGWHERNGGNLSYRVKPEEAELLLPFRTKVKHIEEIALTEDEKEMYYDIHHLPPVGKYRIYVEKPEYIKNDIDGIYEEITNESCIARLQHCLNHLMKNHTLENDDFVYYLAFKDKLMKYLGNQL